jgi:group I intron endonuclease
MTCQKLERRWREGEGYKECTAFYNAIKKYGWHSFTHEILAVGLDFDTACDMEKHYIQKFNSLVEGNGYNLESGGCVKHTLSEISRAKISEANRRRKRKPLSQEHKNRLREFHLGKKQPPRSEDHCEKLSIALTGRVFSKEHCRHISESKLGKYVGENNPRARKVLCVETGRVFNTIKEAGETVGCSPKNIVTCCRGRLCTSGGYHWKYVEGV